VATSRAKFVPDPDFQHVSPRDRLNTINEETIRVKGPTCAVVILVLIVTTPVAIAVDALRGDAPLDLMLIEGTECPICAAYLRHLNQAELETPLVCGRPLSGSSEGIEELSRVFLSAEEIYPIYSKVTNFLRRGNQDFTRRSYNARTKSFETISSPLPRSEQDAIESIRRSIGTSQRSMEYLWQFVDLCRVAQRHAPLPRSFGGVYRPAVCSLREYGISWISA